MWLHSLRRSKNLAAALAVLMIFAPGCLTEVAGPAREGSCTVSISDQPGTVECLQGEGMTKIRAELVPGGWIALRGSDGPATYSYDVRYISAGPSVSHLGWPVHGDALAGSDQLEVFPAAHELATSGTISLGPADRVTGALLLFGSVAASSLDLTIHHSWGDTAVFAGTGLAMVDGQKGSAQTSGNVAWDGPAWTHVQLHSRPQVTQNQAFRVDGSATWFDVGEYNPESGASRGAWITGFGVFHRESGSFEWDVTYAPATEVWHTIVQAPMELEGVPHVPYCKISGCRNLREPALLFP